MEAEPGKQDIPYQQAITLADGVITRLVAAARERSAEVDEPRALTELALQLSDMPHPEVAGLLVAAIGRLARSGDGT
jgi:hypothetical protein